LQGLHSRNGLVEYGGDLLHGQVGEDAKQQHVSLVVGQARTELVDRARAHPGQRVLLHVAAAVLTKCIGAVVGQGGPSASAPPVIDQTPPSDGEHPGAQAGLVPAEGGEAAEDPDEGLAGHVVRLRRSL